MTCANKRAGFLKMVLGILIFMITVPVLTRAQKKPNIIWITCEDISPFLPSFGDSTIRTPNLSRLAAEGIRFTRMFSTYGVCGPSRSSIITGMYPGSIGAMDMRTGTAHKTVPYLPDYEAVPPPEVKCFTEYLRAAGYYCTNNAKTDYQFNCPITAWDENGKKATWQHRAPGQPFFAVFNIGVTHESQIWVRQNRPLHVDPDQVPVPPYFPQHNPVIRTDIARMYDNIMQMDKRVGELLGQLKEAHLMDSTIIVFCSDHGGPIAWYKREVYDRGTHIPFIVRFPDKRRAGTADTALHSLVDMAPTFLSLAGLPIPGYLQGQAFLGKQKAAHSRRYVYTGRDRMDEQYDLIRAVRDNHYQYVRNYDPDISKYHDNAYRSSMPMMREILRLKSVDSLNGPLKAWFSLKPAEELYDLRTDPYELHNIVNEKSYAKVAGRMREALNSWIIRIRDKGFMQEKELIGMMWHGTEKPVTAAPVMKVADHHGNTMVVTMTCPTKGASIAYHLNTDPPDYWHLYTRGITIPQGSTLRAKAIRIGFKPSDESRYGRPTTGHTKQ
jgi:arylsulfatase A-like enzyme